MTIWAWVAIGVAAWLALALLVGLAIASILGRIAQAVSDLVDEEPWASAPLTRDSEALEALPAQSSGSPTSRGQRPSAGRKTSVARLRQRRR